MKRGKKEIRAAVRQRYGEMARAGCVTSEPGEGTSCCKALDVAIETSQEASCCGALDCSLEELAVLTGYSKEEIEAVPEGANMGLGCGNPVALASLKPGERVVDLGSGGGFDCFLAAKEVGEKGKVIGVDMTPDMVSKARRNAEKMGATNVEFRLGDIEHLPVADKWADIIMSNCVINLSPDKLSVYKDAYRVLKAGGRLAISDVLATAPLPEEIRNDLALVGACVGGAETIEETKALLRKAGFQEVEITPKEKSRELIEAWAPEKRKDAWEYVVSAYVTAVKPA